MADLQLSYSFMTVPAVLQAGAADAQLTIVVSNAGAPVTVTGIDFTLRDGTGARDIVNGVTPTTRVMPDGWTHPAVSGGKFSMTPPAPVEISRQGLVFTFGLTVNTVVGTAIIDIVEHIQVKDGPRANRGGLSVPKFPASFVLDGFYSTTPIINQGDSVTLVWTGENLNLANYRLSYSTGNGKKVVDIPAATYSYTVDNVQSTSIFYLHVTSVQSDDTTITFQASQYPITIDPAIMEFWSASSFAAPGTSIMLNWRVSDTVTQGAITCLQSGRTWKLDRPALATGKVSVTTPAISMLTDYVLDVFEAAIGGGDPVKVASRGLQIQTFANVPRPSGAYGQFFTNAQAGDLALTLQTRPVTDDVVPQMIDQIFALFKGYYPEVDFYLDWSNDTVNAQSFVFFDDRKKIVLCGGLARQPSLYYEGFCFIVAQCLARLSGKTPSTQGITYVGAADFYALSDIIRTVFYAITGNSDLINGISTQITTLFNSIPEQDAQGDPHDLANNPAIGCRIVALQNGIFGGNVPACAGGPAQQADSIDD
jgi:hypothetical protein